MRLSQASTFFSLLLLPTLAVSANIPPYLRRRIDEGANITSVTIPGAPISFHMEDIDYDAPKPDGQRAADMATSANTNTGISLLTNTWEPYCYGSGVVEWKDNLYDAINNGCYYMDKVYHWKVPKGKRYWVQYQGSNYPEEKVILLGYQNDYGSGDGWEVKEDECKNWLGAILPACWYNMHCCCCYWTYETQGGWFTTSSGYVFIDPNAV